MADLQQLRQDLRSYVNPEKAAFYPRFFRCSKGDYGEGDEFLGITVPDIRRAIKSYQNLSTRDCQVLLASKWHEERLAALLILVYQYKHASTARRQSIYDLYLASTTRINNWDLVDSSARDIVGAHLYANPMLIPTLDTLAESELLWDRRIAMIATFYFLCKSDPEPTLHIAAKLLHDKEDLIHKAVGWMLRELGKRVDANLLIRFLEDNYYQLPRTTLRYAIEHFEPTTRKRYLLGDFGR